MKNKSEDKWPAERKALKKIQVHFTFQEQLNKTIRHEAVDLNINPSDVVRKVVGLNYQRIQRPRIGLSFSKDEIQQLANKYKVESDDEKEIKKRVMEEVNQHFYKEKGSH